MDNHRATPREFDVIIWGASSYMGQLIAEHLYVTYGANKTLRWAIAGRNEDKLKAVRDGLGSGAAQIPIIIAESHDRALLDAMAKRTSVICSSVGPFLLYGEELVAACIDNGTDYCDLTGEFIWIRRMIDKYEEKARQNNARIVNSCGFDSLPSDLGTLFIQTEMKRRYGVYSPEVRMRIMHGFKSVKMSGGTMSSMVSAFELISQDKQLLKLAYDPNSLLPRGDAEGSADSDIKFPKYEKEIKAWVAPYVLAAGNSKIVRRGNALMGRRYGQTFKYGEGVATGSGLGGWWRAMGASFSLYLNLLRMSIEFTRKRMRKKLPKPGEGMSKEERESNSYRIIFTALHPDANKKFLQAEILGKRDMGYGSSSRMIGETAVSLALDASSRAVAGGFWTPASCLGERLIERLEENAEMKFTALSGAPG